MCIKSKSKNRRECEATVLNVPACFCVDIVITVAFFISNLSTQDCRQASPVPVRSSYGVMLLEYVQHGVLYCLVDKHTGATGKDVPWRTACVALRCPCPFASAKNAPKYASANNQTFYKMIFFNEGLCACVHKEQVQKPQ